MKLSIVVAFCLVVMIKNVAPSSIPGRGPRVNVRQGLGNADAAIPALPLTTAGLADVMQDTASTIVNTANSMNPLNQAGTMYNPLAAVVQPIVNMIRERIVMMQLSARAYMQSMFDRIPVAVKTFILSIINSVRTMIQMAQSKVPIVNEDTMRKTAPYK